eukprot:1142447-Pelagomonas_calceolata.AAC.3
MAISASKQSMLLTLCVASQGVWIQDEQLGDSESLCAKQCTVFPSTSVQAGILMCKGFVDVCKNSEDVKVLSPPSAIEKSNGT